MVLSQAFITTALASQLKDYPIAAHISAEAGHRVLLRHLGLVPLPYLSMQLDEGTGTALGVFLTDAASRILVEMATFEEAGVSEKEG